MRIQPISCLGLLAIGLAASPLHAQADTTTPRAVADSFFRFVAGERYLDAARLMDLESFDAHRRSTVEFARHPMKQRHMTASEFQKFDPKMPRAVAEYQARHFNAQALDMSMMYRHEFGVSTLDSIATLSAEQLAARMLASRDVRTMMRNSLDASRATCTFSAAERQEILSHLRVRPARIFGIVVQDSTAYVLHDGVDLEHVESPSDSTPPPADAAVPIPARPAGRDWIDLPPSFLLLRRVGSAWKVGPSIGSMSTAFASGCNPSHRKAKR